MKPEFLMKTFALGLALKHRLRRQLGSGKICARLNEEFVMAEKNEKLFAIFRSLFFFVDKFAKNPRTASVVTAAV